MGNYSIMAATLVNNQQIVLKYNKGFDVLLSDFEMIESVFENECLYKVVNVELKKLQFEVQLKHLIKVNSNVLSIIRAMKFDELIENENNFEIKLPISIGALYNESESSELIFTFKCFWIKKNSGVLEELIASINDEDEIILYNTIENFRNCVNNPESKVLYNWLMKTKEENLSENQITFFGKNSITRIIEEEEDDDYHEDITSQQSIKEFDNQIDCDLIMNRLEKLNMKNQAARKKNEQQKEKVISKSTQVNDDLYDEFLKLGGKVGTIITDRKSNFQAHGIALKNRKDVDKFTKFLKTNKKIEKATHNITAYRTLDNGNLATGYDDDGENKAGERLLELLNSMKVNNIYVMVSRWYGGIQLGPDRFKHINDSVKSLVLSNKEYFNFN